MYICIAKIRNKTALTHCQRNANNRQAGGFSDSVESFLNISNVDSVEYLLSDLDKQDKDDKDKQVVNNAQCSNDDVDDLEYKVTDGNQILLYVVRFRQRCRGIVPNIRR